MRGRIFRCTLTMAENLLAERVWADLREALATSTSIRKRDYEIDCTLSRVSYVYFSNGTRMIIDH
jgi:hypothetical protein